MQFERYVSDLYRKVTIFSEVNQWSEHFFAVTEQIYYMIDDFDNISAFVFDMCVSTNR